MLHLSALDRRYRRELEAKELARKNEEMRQRLKAVKAHTDDGDGGQEEEREALERTSHVWKAAYLQYERMMQNQQLAKDERDIQAAQRTKREQKVAAFLASARTQSTARMERQERLNKLQEEVRLKRMLVYVHAKH